MIKEEYDIIMQDYLNILRQNFELQRELAGSPHIRLVKRSNK